MRRANARVWLSVCIAIAWPATGRGEPPPHPERRRTGLALILSGVALTVGGTASAFVGGFAGASGGEHGNGDVALGIGLAGVALGQALVCIGIPLMVPPRRDVVLAAADPAEVALRLRRARRAMLGSAVALGLSGTLLGIGAVLLAVPHDPSKGGYDLPAAGVYVMSIGGAGVLASAPILGISARRHARYRRLASPQVMARPWLSPNGAGMAVHGSF